MSESFDFIVVGKGMMGAAAARHLGSAGAKVALVGPDEPKDWANHAGVFSSHYDNARITRTIDDDPVWARLARRSIERYDAIERESGITFYHPVGCLIAGPAPGAAYDYIEQVEKARDALGVEAPLYDGDALSQHFPWFHFPKGTAGVHERRGAGYINPRALVAAQTACAAKAGVRIVRAEVAAVTEERDRVVVATVDGKRFEAGRVIVAAGGFSISAALLPRPIDLTVKARTVFFAEVASGDLSDYEGMPSLIGAAPEQEKSYYLLPPVGYADGKHYIKIGGDPTDRILREERDVRQWFRGSGGATAAEHLRGLLAEVMTEFVPVSTHFSPCVTSFTRNGLPYIGFAEGERVAVVTGGNGQAAKSSDEIGRLGALLVLDGRIDEPDYDADFSVVFR